MTGIPPTNNGDNSPFNRTARHDAKHTAILSEAARLFNTTGSRATTLKDIAESLGLTKSSLYHYVKTKEELIYQCYMATIDHQNAILDDQQRENLSSLEQLIGFYRQHVKDWLAAKHGNGPYSAGLLEIASLKEKHRTEVQGRYVDMFKRLRQCVRDGSDDGSIRPCEATSAARAFLGSLPAWSDSWLHRMPLEQVPEISEQALDIVLHGLRADSGETPVVPIEVENPGSVHSRGFISRKEESRLKQEAFAKAGTAFFNRKGFKSTSLDEISEHLKVSKGAFYYYIKNKEDLLFNCYTFTLDATQAIHSHVEDLDLTGMEKVEQVCRRMFIVENSDAGPLIRFTSLTALPPARREKVVARIAKSNHRFGEFIREGLQDGSIRPINDLVAEHLVSSATNASLNMELWRKIDDIDAAAMDYFDIFFSGLAAR
jgi:AcrR family transcriptional regulator